MEKILQSSAIIRFQDCDPFNHLNNSRYLDYFVNAREDQILEHYKLDVYTVAAREKISWVITANQIAYFLPAIPMEKVWIETKTIDYWEKGIKIESTMWNEKKTHLKSLLWASLTHIDLTTMRSIPHSPYYQELFQSIVVTGIEDTFEDRAKKLKAEFNSR